VCVSAMRVCGCMCVYVTGNECVYVCVSAMRVSGCVCVCGCMCVGVYVCEMREREDVRV